MIYLNSFSFPSTADEIGYLANGSKALMTCYDSRYPFQVFLYREMPEIHFGDITIFYGSNGSGKSTALNVIADKTKLRRESEYNRTDFMEPYLELCDFECEWNSNIPPMSRIITSDDVFDYLLDIRSINNGIDRKRGQLLNQYKRDREEQFQFHSLDDLDELKRRNKAKSQTKLQYVRNQLVNNIREQSNGESALSYFSTHINEPALYLLDEPENSLSAAMQLRLKSYIEETARYDGSQFVISTHSPFLLSIKGAKIYNLDAVPICRDKWTNLENVRIYQQFFYDHRHDFSTN